MKTRWCPTCATRTPTDTLTAQTDGHKTVPEREFCARCGLFLGYNGRRSA